MLRKNAGTSKRWIGKNAGAVGREQVDRQAGNLLVVISCVAAFLYDKSQPPETGRLYRQRREAQQAAGERDREF